MVKRIFDFFVSIIGLVILFPLFILISISIFFLDPGDIFFLQIRVGRYGKLFTLYKFRTMTKNNNFKSHVTVSGDIRITKIGQILRKYKLDELPSLLNVFLGKMSLVGPRPDVPGYADKLLGNNTKILKLRPGITSPASIKYANEESLLLNKIDPQEYNDNIIFPDKIKLNLEYYENQSLWLDIKIIFATIFRTSY